MLGSEMATFFSSNTLFKSYLLHGKCRKASKNLINKKKINSLNNRRKNGKIVADDICKWF
jgi:hypothetical protein